MLPPFQIEQTITTLVREDWGRMLASLVSSFRDWQLAEDVLQYAVEQAIIHWQRDGLPNSPAAWLITTAKRQALDHYRKSARFNQIQPELAYIKALEQSHDLDDLDNVIPDKRLELIFTCCHPALEQKTQVALTLHTLGGLSTDEIAHAYLDKPQSMAQRLSRAKKKIQLANIPFVIPEKNALRERLSAVLSVIYLIFNEGYSASSGKQITRTDLCDEAIRLARIVLHLLPEQSEVAGLLSLMLLHDSRRLTRQDENQQMISLELQDRSAWDKGKISEGAELLKLTLPKQQIGAYQLQAAISAVHAEALNWQSTDWAQISALYKLLYEVQPSAVVRINQAVAVSYAESTSQGLAMLNDLEKASSTEVSSTLRYQPFYAARADLHRRNGDINSAKKDFKKAIELSDNEPQKVFLNKRLNDLSK